MIITQKITVPLDHREELPAVDMVQGDTGRSLAISLLLDGKAWTIPDGVKAVIRYRRSDGSGGCYDTLPNGATAYGISGGTITVYPLAQLTAVAGIVELQVALMVGEVVLTAFTVLLSVQADPSLEALDPESYSNLSGWIQEEMDRRWESVFNDDGYINSKVNDLHFRTNTEFTLGTISTVDGIEDTSGTHIRSGFIAHGGRQMTVVIPEGVQALVFYYDKNYSFVGRTVIYSKTFTAYHAAAYARVVAFYADEAIITDVAALAQKITVCYRSDTHSAFRGDIVLLGIKYFSLCTQEGYYRFNTEDLSAIGDAPDLGCGGILEVKPYAGGPSRLQIIRTTDGQVWSRYSTQPFQRLVPPAEGTDGATFTPAVSVSGDLSWTNDQGLENPATINIMGPQGEKGDTGETGITPQIKVGNVETLDAGSDAVVSISGSDEAPVLRFGIPRGYTPVKGTDYFTDTDKQDLITALKGELTTEIWTFTLEDNTVVEKAVLLG